MDKLKLLGETIRTLMDGEFSGYIRINFTQGSLGRVEKSEEIDAAIGLPAAEADRQRREERTMHHENA